MNKERIYYWISIVIIAIFFIALYGQYLDLEQTLDDSQRISNRQMSMTVHSWNSKTLSRDEKIKLLEKQMVELEEHHKQEITELIEFYTEEIKND